MNKLLFIAALCLVSAFAINPPHFSQGDSRWGGQVLGFGPDTIKQAGCLMTSVTSMASYAGVKIYGVSPIPSTMNTWLKANGGFVSGDLFVWGSIAKLGFTYHGKTTSTNDAVNALKAGKYVILNVNKGHHYVLATGIVSGGFSVMDPGFAKTSYTFGEVVNSAIYTH